MATLLAISWENDRLRLLSATTSGKTITFNHAAQIDEPKDIGRLITQYRLARAETVVILNRSDVEVRPMVFPPVPTAELPDLVRFQAGREFNHYDPNAPVDFFVTNKLEDVSRSTLFPAIKSSDSSLVSAGSPKHLLASTLRSGTFQQIKSFCEEHHLVLRHIVLRPCAAAALWRHAGNSMTDQSVLLVELDFNEASQVIAYQGAPVFMRSPKIARPTDVSLPDFAARILAEMKRTRIAARNEIQGIDVNEVILFGTGPQFASLADQLSEGLDIPIRLFDPVQGLTVKTTDANELYAPHFGALLQVARKEPLQIDFCNPKRRAEDTSKRNLLTAVLATVLVLIGSFFSYAFYTQITLRDDVRRLTVKLNELQKTSGAVVDQKRQLDELEKWRADGINWFEQLTWLSQNALPADEMMIRDLRFNTTQAGGTIDFVALLRSPSLVSPMVDRFRGPSHTPVLGQAGPETGGTRMYQHRGAMTIRLSKGQP